MASIEERKDKSGKITGYRMRVCVGREEGTYKQVWRTMFVPYDDDRIFGLTPAKLETKLNTIMNTWADAEKKKYDKDHAKTDKSRTTLENFINEHWIPTCVENGKHRTSTISYYKFMASDILDFFGKSIKISSIDSEDIKKYIKFMNTTAKTKQGKSYSDSTKKHHYTALSTILEDARRMRYIPFNPCDDIKTDDKPQVERKEVDYLHTDDMERFFTALKDEPLFWRTFVTTLIVCGLRRGEAIGLQWSDIDTDNMTLTISRSVTMDSDAPNKLKIGEPKTKASKRSIPLPKDLYDMMMELKKDQEERLHISASPSAFIFSRQSDPSRPVFPTEPTRYLSKFTKKNKLPSLSPHDLRHSCATIMKQNKVSDKEIQSIMGHTSFTVTNDNYIGTSNEEQRDAINGICGKVFAV